jgi:hypothetical protein
LSTFLCWRNNYVILIKCIANHVCLQDFVVKHGRHFCEQVVAIFLLILICILCIDHIVGLDCVVFILEDLIKSLGLLDSSYAQGSNEDSIGAADDPGNFPTVPADEVDIYVLHGLAKLLKQ